MLEQIKFWIQDNKHKVVVMGIMMSAIVTGMLIIGSGHENFLAEAGRHRN